MKGYCRLWTRRGPRLLWQKVGGLTTYFSTNFRNFLGGSFYWSNKIYILETHHFFFFFKQSVKSYGTEDRHTERPVPPKDEIYEYIIFRGSDIKDITVSEPPKPHHGLPRDPAIVQVC